MKKIIYKSYRFYFLLLASIACFLGGCKKLDVFEKNTPVPAYKWQYNWKPSFDFDISDTSQAYKVYIVLRHTDAYKYNNIWLNIGTQFPSDSSLKYQRFELALGNDTHGWEGTGMDDIWEVRKLITNGPVKFSKAGKYKFIIAQVMREDPLPNIVSVGVRVEKAD